MDVLAPIPYVLWVHGQGLTSLGHNQYTMRILFIQVSEYPWLWALVAMPKSDISGVVEVVWCHWHSSRPLWWCWNIHLRPIPSVLQHQGVMVGLTWPSTPCIPPDYGVWAWICNNLIYLGWFKFKVYGTIIMAQGQYNGVGTFIWDLYQVCYNTREQWFSSHDPQYNISTPDFGPWLCNNLIHLGWLKLCGAITG